MIQRKVSKVSEVNPNNRPNMKLPKATNDEDHPFLDTKKSVRIAMENLAAAPGSKGKYAVKNTRSILRRLWSNTLMRWILMVAVLLFVFVMGSKYYSNVPSEGFQVSEIPELDFTLDNLISASIGLSALAADKIISVKVIYHYPCTIYQILWHHILSFSDVLVYY